MILTRSLADKIVQKTKELTSMHMNVMNVEGVIISSSDPARIGSYHEGAAKVIETGTDQIVTEETSRMLMGTKPGINMPVRFEDAVIGVIGITGKPEEAGLFGKAVQMMTELLLQQAFLSEQVGTEEKIRDFLVQDLIAGQFDGPMDNVLARGRMIGVDLSVPRSVLIVQMEQEDLLTDSLDMQRSLSRKIAKLFPNPGQVLCSRIQRSQWVLITEANMDKRKFEAVSDKIRNLFMGTAHIKVHIVAGRTARNVETLHLSYKEALSLLKIIRLFPDDAAIRHFDDLGLELLCAETTTSTRSHIIERSLGALPRHPDLMETLAVFFRCHLNIAFTAKMLRVHRNTLLYRLDRIQELTGSNPRDFGQAAQMHVALMLLRIHDQR